MRGEKYGGEEVVLQSHEDGVAADVPDLRKVAWMGTTGKARYGWAGV